MTIIVTRAKIFMATVNGEAKRLTVEPKPQMQTVEDWIQDTDLYKLSVKDGSITEVEVKSKAPDVAQPSQPGNPSASFTEPVNGLAGTPQTVAGEAPSDNLQPNPSLPFSDEKSNRGKK
jgi:hypothetical protein